MSLALLIYLANISEQLSNLFGIIAAFLGVTLALSFLFVPMAFDLFNIEFEEAKGTIKKAAKIIIASILLSSLAYCVLPDKTTIYMMIGADMAQSAFQSETGEKIMTIINQKLDEEIKELKK